MPDDLNPNLWLSAFCHLSSFSPKGSSYPGLKPPTIDVDDCSWGNLLSSPPSPPPPPCYTPPLLILPRWLPPPPPPPRPGPAALSSFSRTILTLSKAGCLCSAFEFKRFVAVDVWIFTASVFCLVKDFLWIDWTWMSKFSMPPGLPDEIFPGVC